MRALQAPFVSARAVKRRFGPWRSMGHVVVTFFAVLMLPACEREKRDFHPTFKSPQLSYPMQIPSVQAGGGPHQPEPPLQEENNAYAVSQGKELFTNFNCSTCHANGGGDIGPPLIDAKWRYGSAPRQIYASIVEGRPNGMPSFGQHITNAQVWEIVAYVNLAGLTSGTAAPGRDDHLQASPPPNNATSQAPLTEPYSRQ